MIISAHRKILHLALAISNPRWVDQLLAFSIQELVDGADRSIASISDNSNLFRGLWSAEKMGSHIDARSCDGDRRTTSKMVKAGSLLSKRLCDFDNTLAFKSKVAGITNDEVASIGGSGCDVCICGRVHSLR
jgi:hypothetical protein